MMDGVWAVKYRYSSMWVGGRETKGSGRVPGFIASFWVPASRDAPKSGGPAARKPWERAEVRSGRGSSASHSLRRSYHTFLSCFPLHRIW